MTTPAKRSIPHEVVAINFVADAGKLMLESSTSVSEVQERLREFLPAVGLEGCSLDANMSSLILSYWQPGQSSSLTTMREIQVATPRLERLSGADALLDEVQSGSIDLADAAKRLAALGDTPPPPRLRIRLAMVASVAGWVVFLDGLTLATLAIALLAVVVTFPIDGLVERLRFPTLAATFLFALVVAVIPNLAAVAGISVLVGPAVVGVLYPHLPGRAFVSSVIDGLANAPVSSISRGIQAMAVAGALAVGMLAGNGIGAGLGLNYQPDAAATPLLLSLAGAALGVLGLAIAWAMPRRGLVPTVAISAGGWALAALLTPAFGGPGGWPAYGIAAGAVGIAGAMAASRQGSSPSVYTGVAILPLVPGFALYTGMLALAQGDTSTAATSLGTAAVVSMAIAIGVAVGLALGRDAVALTHRVTGHSADPASPEDN